MTSPTLGQAARRRLCWAILTSLLATLPASSPWAAEIEDIAFEDSIQIGTQRLELSGLGLLRYRVFFRGYVGGLYLEEGTPASRALENVPKVLELYYFWDIEGRFFGEAADELLQRNQPPERIAKLRPSLDELHALYRDVKAGDRYRLSYMPGQGTTLSLNGEVLGTVGGADLGTDYFGIWLGDKPLNTSFRDQILESSAP